MRLPEAGGGGVARRTVRGGRPTGRGRSSRWRPAGSAGGRRATRWPRSWPRRCSPRRRRGSVAASTWRTPRPAGREGLRHPARRVARRGGPGRAGPLPRAPREDSPTRCCSRAGDPLRRRRGARRSRRGRRPPSGAPCRPRPAPRPSGRITFCGLAPEPEDPAPPPAVAAARLPRAGQLPGDVGGLPARRRGTTASTGRLVVGVAWDGRALRLARMGGGRGGAALDRGGPELPPASGPGAALRGGAVRSRGRGRPGRGGEEGARLLGKGGGSPRRRLRSSRRSSRARPDSSSEQVHVRVAVGLARGFQVVRPGRGPCSSPPSTARPSRAAPRGRPPASSWKPHTPPPSRSH